MKKYTGTIFGIDFDGTVVTHEFPKVGKDIPGSVETLDKIVRHGGRLVLWTMRANHTKKPQSHDPDIHTEAANYLDEAIKWFADRELPLWGVNRNPEQDSWTSSPKAYCHIYIDDAALGCPLTHDTDISNRPFVNWSVVHNILFP